MTGLILGAVVLFSAGYAKLSSMVLNRLLSMTLPTWANKLLEIIQLLSMPAYGVTLLFALYSRHAGFGGLNWQTITSGELLLILAGAIGFGFLVHSTIAFQSYRPPLCEIGNDSRIIDFRTECTEHVSKRITSPHDWKNVLVGPGPRRSIALLPGNQQFSLEVSTKTYSLPRLPPAWEGLSIVHLADTHFRGAVTRKYFELVCEQAQALKPDLYVFSGDLFDDMALLDWLQPTLGQLKAPLGQYFILGNHDWYLDPNVVRKEYERDGWIDLSSRCIELHSSNSGPPIVIAGDETPWMGKHPDLSHVSPETFRILISHTPDNVFWARGQKFDLMLAGHTHGGQIRLPLLGPVYAPSRYGCRFTSGVFWMDPTLMYVARGISGREPIRYNCVPELTKLVLRSGQQGFRE